MKINYKMFYGFILPIAIFFIWLIASQLNLVNNIILPSPGAVFSDLLSLLKSGDIQKDIGWTLLRTCLGFIVGVSLGVLFGIAMGSWQSVHNAMIFSVDSLRSIPATSLFPLFMLFLGLGLKSMVALIAFPCCWLVTINTMYGVRNSSRIRKEMAEIYRLSKYKKFFYVTLPDAAPSIAASLRLSIAICLHMAIISEMFMGSLTGIGRRINEAQLLLNVSEMYSFIIIAGVLGYVINLLFSNLETKVTFWGGHS